MAFADQQVTMKLFLNLNTMKSILLLVSGLLVIFSCETGSANTVSDNQTIGKPDQPTGNALIITSSPELYDLTSYWVREFTRLNPTVNITIGNFNNGSESGNNLSFVSDEFPAVKDESKWKMVIGHDAIVPVINAKNPMLHEISLQGVSASLFSKLISEPDKMNWASIIIGGQNAAAKIYMLDNDFVKTSIADFTKTGPSPLNGIMIATPADLISAVQNDLYAIGFCRLKDIRKANTNEFIGNIMLLPVDKNSNGRIDNFENIYKSPDAFSRGVWVGKYPNKLCGSIYAISSVKPEDKNALSFLTWVLAEGSQSLNINGYNDLTSNEKLSNLSILTNTEITSSDINNAATSYMWIIILMVIVIAGVIIAAVISILKKEKSTVSHPEVQIISVLNENLIAAPKGLYFDKTHTWAFMERDGIVKVGIDDFLQHITGTLTKIKMKEPGEKVRKGEKILSIIRNGKQLNIYAPVSGIIREKNQRLLIDSSIMNTSPYSEGWVYMIEPKNWVRETEFLFMGEKYKEWLKDEFRRLKDFFAASVMSDKLVYEHIILQDGGELSDNVLADLSPEVWENFQTSFIDTSR
jgi:glycine cleavage system H lipoate-binding protein/ABC-type phosphate transport system substrate-binding protein